MNSKNPPKNLATGPENGAANSLWGGRFSEAPDALMTAINASIAFDKRLAQQDLRASKAHVTMLCNQGIVKAEDSRELLKGLERVAEEIKSGRFPFREELEDIHMNVETRLSELGIKAAGRLHTARSRNDQVATDFRLWVRDALLSCLEKLDGLIEALLNQAEPHSETLMPGFTHLQNAQPVSFAHHLLAYVEMFWRDRSRFCDAYRRMNYSPLGAAALAGTGFPIDRDFTAKELGFEGPMRNSIDAVSDRDFALEFLAVASLTSLHLSRLAEEIVIWSSAPFGFVRLSDAFSTGSSIMPQKRNPDAAELLRAKTGRIMGDFLSLATVMKGLPLAYSKDMQEDKEPCFDAADTLELSLSAMCGIIADMKADPQAMRKACEKGHITATDLADWLVRELGYSFRQAHSATGELVKRAEATEKPLEAVSLEELRKVAPDIHKGIYSVLSPEASLASKTSFGGTAPVRVRQALKDMQRRFAAREVIRAVCVVIGTV